jgi:V/A-type H+-transporting ATPase subunit C
MQEEYIYAVARVRSRELSLLNRQDIDQLMSCKTYEECLRTLADKGWGDGTNLSAEELFTLENQKIWDFIRELTSDLSPFDVLLYPIDYNNLKAAIKATVTGVQPVRVFLAGGTVEPELMRRAVQENNFSLLPEEMSKAAEEAYHTLLETGDGQLCDVLLDKACLIGMLCRGKESGSPIIEAYAQQMAAVSDIKIAVRSCKTGKTRAFLEAALVPCDTLDAEALALAATKSLEEIFSYLSTTAYDEAARRLKESYSAFEKWCDDKVMDLIKEQKSNPFSIGPLFAYIIARQNEIAVVRIILSGKLNQLDDGMIRERLRDMYV